MTTRDLTDIEKWVREGTNLANGDFTEAKLDSHRLQNGQFAGSDFSGAGLSHSDLTDANLTGAKLIGAFLYSCHLNGANFTDADLTNADLQNSSLEEAIFDDCKGIVDAGIDPRGYRFIGVKTDADQTGGWMIKAGCRWFTVDEAKEHWGPGGRNNRDALARVVAIITSG
jgi:uncharacterized protein YjbI with pentapeptide repeats